MRIHIIGNVYRQDALKAISNTAKWLAKRDVQVGIDQDTGRHLSLPVVSFTDFPQADLVVAFGGDGTLIRAAHLCSEVGTPILGVYYGRFGFVTQCTSESITPCLELFLNGKAEIESRMMLEAQLIRGGQVVGEIHALNEVVLQRDVTARMMVFQVRVDGCDLTLYAADGVLFSTPTGSNGYNLSSVRPLLRIRASGS